MLKPLILFSVQLRCKPSHRILWSVGLQEIDLDQMLGYALVLNFTTAVHVGRTYTMPLYIDVHNKIDGLTAETVAEAHQKDLEVQHKYKVRYLRYWFDESAGKVFCLVEAPTKEDAEAVHREAHGQVADEIIEVQEGA